MASAQLPIKSLHSPSSVDRVALTRHSPPHSVSRGPDDVPRRHEPASSRPVLHHPHVAPGCRHSGNDAVKPSLHPDKASQKEQPLTLPTHPPPPPPHKVTLGSDALKQPEPPAPPLPPEPHQPQPT